MKKWIGLLLMLSVLFLYGCEETEVSQTTDTSVSGSETMEQTTSESSDDTSVTQTTETGYYQPNVTETPWEPDWSRAWQYTPAVNIDFEAYPFYEEDYDIECYIDDPEFPVSEIPAYFMLNIVNHTGKPFWCMIEINLEKRCYNPPDSDVVPYVGGGQGYGWFWVRVPFSNISHYSWGRSYESTMQIRFSAKGICDKNFVLNPGEYRFVFYAADGPHYAYFTITE